MSVIYIAAIAVSFLGQRHYKWTSTLTIWETQKGAQTCGKKLCSALYQQLPAVTLGLVSDPLINNLPVETKFQQSNLLWKWIPVNAQQTPKCWFFFLLAHSPDCQSVHLPGCPLGPAAMSGHQCPGLPMCPQPQQGIEHLPIASQNTVEPLEWTAGEGSGLWYHWISAKCIFLVFIPLLFFPVIGEKTWKIFLRLGIVVPFQDWPLCLSRSCCNECCPTFRKPLPFKSPRIFIHLPSSSRDCQVVDVAEPIEWQRG